MGIVHVVYSRSKCQGINKRELQHVKFEHLLLGEGECFTHGEVERQNQLSRKVQLNTQGYLRDYEAQSKVLGR
jgi:hypothetical protein